MRDPLAAILTLAVSAILANHRLVLAIAEWGARQSPEHRRTLGVDDGRTPCQSTVQRRFRHLDRAALAQTLTHCVTSPAAEAGPPGIAIDGKAPRGRVRCAGAGGGGPVHALRAFCHEQGIVLAHEPIIATTAKAEADLTVAPTLLDRLDWHGRVLTGDALFCQRARCPQVHDVGGDDLLLVKETPPDLQEAIALLFDPPPVLARRPRDDLRITRTIDTGHGRRPEIRELPASTDLTT
ncbi:MAG: ISAs1 family transposase [Chloroflexota bacterium]|nr:ISAs1 family transposase [Chloroflexota bacterium]